MTERVLISGASGYIASHTVAALLEAGFAVTGTVRDPGREASVAHLKALPGAHERLELVRADLTEPGAFEDCVGDADYVVHMASPYQLTVRDPEQDLVRPAVEGTLAMLEACAKAPGVRRVVLTSSMAAITDEPDGNRVLTEADWNEKSSLTRNPYYYSKTRAERAAWDFVEDHAPAFDLVVINPFLVVGPSLTPTVNESPKVLLDLMAGAYPAIMDLTLGFVDVRDVAEAHVRALQSERASGRYICAGETMHLREVVALLRENGYAHTKLPKLGLDSALGNRLMWLASFTQPKGVGTYLRSHLGRVPRYDNAKVRADLGLEFRPARDSILDTCRDFEKWGHVAPAGKAA